MWWVWCSRFGGEVCMADYGGGFIWRILTVKLVWRIYTAVFWDFSIEHSPIEISYNHSCTAFSPPTLLTHLPSPLLLPQPSTMTSPISSVLIEI